ncbi:hypothetical protein ACFZCY_03560 [Streptomyces sp. NPDC007983]|uniref:hypothetical protein n=1 Tax=Streptomyces sp. NPDC007983 TaxID=3364800 RepID=UPI0036EE3419
MGRGRGGDDGIRKRTVRATVRSALRRVAPLLAVLLWVAPLCVHSGGDHPPMSAGCPHRLVAEPQPEWPPPAPALPIAEFHTAPPAAGDHPKAPGGGSDDCVAGPRGGNPALVPAPVPPPAPAGFRPPEAPRGMDAVRAPPDTIVHALGLHQLQVLRT